MDRLSVDVGDITERSPSTHKIFSKRTSNSDVSLIEAVRPAFEGGFRGDSYSIGKPFCVTM